jgi:hypothetical protein
MANASAVQDMNLTTQVLPTDKVALKLRFVVSGFVSNGLVNVTGTDKDGNAQTETNIAVTGNGNYSTSLWFATVSSKGLDCNGSYAIAVYQLQWGEVWKQTTNQYAFDARLCIGDSSTVTYFTDSNRQVTYYGSGSAGGSNWIDVKNASIVTFGILVNAVTYATDSGIAFLFSFTSNYAYISADSGAVCDLYSCSVSGIGCISRIKGDGIRRIWNFIGNRFRIGQISASSSLYNLYIAPPNTEYALISAMAGTMNKIVIRGTPSYYAFLSASSNISNLDASGATAKSFDMGGASGYIHYLINPILDVWTFNWAVGSDTKVYREYTFDLSILFNNNTALENAKVTLSRYGQGGAVIGAWLTNSSGQIATQTLSMGFYNQTGADAIYNHNPYNLTITKDGYQTYTGNFTLSQKTNWTIALQPLTDGGLIEHVGFVPVDPGLTSPSGTYRWLDVADQAYGIDYRNSYNYSQSTVEVAYCTEGNTLQGLLKAKNLKPNFAYQLKLVGTPGTADNERIGLAGRWWQEEWTGTKWANGQNLNDKGNGSSPNPNDQTYLSRRYIQDSSSPTGYHYRYTGYLVFNYFITDSNGTTTLQFETGSCYHVIWKTTQRSNATNDVPVKTVTFDPAPSQPAYDTDYPSNTVSIFGEWERLPMGQVNLQPGEYNCQILLTEESFHGSGGTLAGNWAGAVTANIMFTIN